MSSTEPLFRPRPLSRRTWVRLGLIAVVVAVLYAAVAFFYNSEGGVTYVDRPETLDIGVTAAVDPVVLNAQTNIVSLQMTFGTLGDLADANGRLTQNLRIVVDSWAGSRELKFPMGTVLSPANVDLGLTGELAQYPFDVHEGGGFISADTYTKNSDGSVTSVDTVPVSVSVTNGVNGWDTAADVSLLSASTSFDFTFARAFSTQVFALMLLALAVMLAAATVIVAFLVASQRRKAEIGLMSWTAALLFALPALRTFMPNSPPIGAAIDMYVYLWVMAGAIAAAIIMIVSWVRQSGRLLIEDPTAAGGGVPGIPGAPSADVTGD
jgi:Domain of unknown function (DUF4436)